MKGFIGMVMLSILCSPVCAQMPTWDELFAQKKTQKRYLIEQVAALKGYAALLAQTYSIAQDGLDAIGLKTGRERDLHLVFFKSLKAVNPEISRHSRAVDIVLLQVSMIKGAREIADAIKDSDQFTPEEITYMTEVIARLFASCVKLVDETIRVTSKDKLELKDDERFERIDAVYQEMMQHYAFLRQFGNTLLNMRASRVAANAEIHNSLQWHINK